MAIKHSTQINSPNNPGYAISSNAWNLAHTIDNGTITSAMLASDVTAEPLYKIYKSGSMYYARPLSPELGLSALNASTADALINSVSTTISNASLSGGGIRFAPQTFSLTNDVTFTSLSFLDFAGYGSIIIGGRFIFDGQAVLNRMNAIRGFTFSGSKSGIRMQGGSQAFHIIQNYFAGNAIGLEVQNGSSLPGLSTHGWQEDTLVELNQFENCLTSEVIFRAPLSTGQASYDHWTFTENFYHAESLSPHDSFVIEAGDGTNQNPTTYKWHLRDEFMQIVTSTTNDVYNCYRFGKTPAGGSGTGSLRLSATAIDHIKFENDGAFSNSYSSIFPFYFDALSNGHTAVTNAPTFGEGLATIGSWVTMGPSNNGNQLIFDAATSNFANFYGFGCMYFSSAVGVPVGLSGAYSTETQVSNSSNIAPTGLDLREIDIVYAGISGGETITAQIIIYLENGNVLTLPTTNYAVASNQTVTVLWSDIFTASTSSGSRYAPIAFVTAKAKTSAGSTSATVKVNIVANSG